MWYTPQMPHMLASLARFGVARFVSAGAARASDNARPTVSRAAGQVPYATRPAGTTAGASLVARAILSSRCARALTAIEMAMLELLGKATGRPVADFFGGVIRRDIPIYVASGTRGNTPEDEVERLKKLVADSGAKALKFRLGGRMSRNVDSLPGRSEALIPLARKAFGDQFTLYADANSSYDVANSIRIGRMMQEHGYGFFEEPVPFDDLWGTKEVADALGLGNPSWKDLLWDVIGTGVAISVSVSIDFGVRAAKGK